MGLCLQRDHTLDILDAEPVAGALIGRSELLNNRTLCEGYIILIGRENLVGVLLSGLLNHGEERAFYLLAIDNEGTTENLVAAVLRVDLCKTKDL